MTEAGLALDVRRLVASNIALNTCKAYEGPLAAWKHLAGLSMDAREPEKTGADGGSNLPLPHLILPIGPRRLGLGYGMRAVKFGCSALTFGLCWGVD